MAVTDESDERSCDDAELTVTVAPEKKLYVELLWNTPADPNQSDEGPEAGADMDLHFAHPFATSVLDLDDDGSPDPWFDNPFDVFWFNSNPNWGSLSPAIDDNPRMVRDDSDGAGPEAIDLEMPETLTYRVGVHYWKDHSFGASDARVRIYIDGTLAFDSGTATLSNRDMWWVAEVAWNPSTPTATAITAMGGGHKITPNYNHPLFPDE